MTDKSIIGENELNQNESMTLKDDPLEAIFALNFGDFVTDHLISEDLLSKINCSFKDKITRLKNQLRELISIYSLDQTLSLLGFSSNEESVIYNAIAQTISQMLEIESCNIYIQHTYINMQDKKGEDSSLILIGSSSNNQDACNVINLSSEEKNNIFINAYLKKKTIYQKNDDGKIFSLVVPMANNYECIGLIVLNDSNQKQIEPEQIKLLEVTSQLIVTSMMLQNSIEQTEITLNSEERTPDELMHLRTELTANIGDLGDDQQSFVESLADVVDVKCHYKKEHSQKVANIAREISGYLHLNEKTIDLIYYAAFLHNIGKITIPQEIFSKKGRLTEEDWLQLNNHPNIGVSLLMKINFMSEVIPYIHYHRERWDGMGEPEGLSGFSIPLGSRIIAVADAYQALLSQRPYRDSIESKDALEIMKEEAGIKWDPVVVDALIKISK